MQRASEYWSFVRECEQWANRIGDEQDRRVFFDMAKAWMELALKEQSAFKSHDAVSRNEERVAI